MNFVVVIGMNAGARIRRLRQALGYMEMKEFAEFLGIGENRLGNIERDQSPLSKDVALRIREKVPGMTLDWLFYGDATYLSPGLAQLIGELPRGSKGHSDNPRRI